MPIRKLSLPSQFVEQALTTEPLYMYCREVSIVSGPIHTSALPPPSGGEAVVLSAKTARRKTGVPTETVQVRLVGFLHGPSQLTKLQPGAAVALSCTRAPAWKP